MTYYEYKVVPAPRRIKRSKGVSAPGDLFALTLTEAINEQAREGWEYVRAETMSAEAPRGWFRRAVEEEQTVLVFRRERETLGPRLAAVPEPDDAANPDAEDVRPAATRRNFADRVQAGMSRREPRLDGPTPPATPPTPLRPAPRLGPAEPT